MPKLLLIVMMIVLVGAFALQSPVSGYHPHPKPIFKNDSQKLTAEMDLTYCWFATFKNKTTGKSHTLHNAYDKTGKPCH